MTAGKKRKQRGFIMTGGGAKGLYEAGVMQAFHITGMDFDVVTGSSIGAMNSIVFAEYLRRKRCLPDSIQADPDAVIKSLDPFMRAFHYAWLRMEHLNIIDDSESGPFGRLKGDLNSSDLNLPLLVRLAWWRTTPEAQNPSIPWTDLIRLGKELVARVGVTRAFKVIGQVTGGGSIGSAVTAYLERMNLRQSLVSPYSPGENSLRDTFTRNELVLQERHLPLTYLPVENESGERETLLSPDLTLKDYEDARIDVRLTRANYRTGRLEISAYLTPEDFVAYLESQLWRTEASPQTTPPLGSHRLQIPGNPSAIGAALASGRFPGVFAPFPIDRIYDLARPENDLLQRLLNSWLADSEVEAQLKAAYTHLHSNEPDKIAQWSDRYIRWRDAERFSTFFPRSSDVYVDGGAIDNTPSNSAVDSVREWIKRSGYSKREVILDLYVIYLHPEPSIDLEKVDDPTLFQTVDRTLKIQSAAKLSSDAVVIDTINTFGNRAEELGESLQLLLEALKPLVDTLSLEQKAALEERVQTLARQRQIKGYRSNSSGILDSMEAWAQKRVREDLPLEVNEIKIYPDEMPLSTLNFTQRLGYRKEKAIAMIVMGCANTLWSLRSNLERMKDDERDDQDLRVLSMARKWMGGGVWPDTYADQVALRESWRCQRTECVFHRQYCPRGARRQL